MTDLEELVGRLEQLEDREAELECQLTKLLGRQRGLPGDAVPHQIAVLQRDHLDTRRELNTIRARLVPVELTSAR
jgi:predicted  nucleic acid-binding Zn-ribbon protein